MNSLTPRSILACDIQLKEPTAMREVSLINEPCHCPSGRCAHLVEPDENCINRYAGDVRTKLCPVQKAFTWHQDGRCLACAYAETRGEANPNPQQGEE